MIPSSAQMPMPSSANKKRQESNVKVETSFTLCLTKMKLKPNKIEDIVAQAMATPCLFSLCFIGKSL